jgi:hypothetical protein
LSHPNVEFSIQKAVTGERHYLKACQVGSFRG